MKKILTAALLLPLLCATAYADTELLAECQGSCGKTTAAKPKTEMGQTTPAQTETPAKPGKGVQGDKLNRPIPLYATYDNDGWGLGLRGDVLYMNYSSPIRTFVSAVTTAGTAYTSEIFDVKSTGSVGCDLGLTYTRMSDPGYTFGFDWFHIVSTFNHNVSGPSLLPSHIVAATLQKPGTANNNGALTINFFDMMVSKSYRLGDPFTFAPAIGVIGGYMDSHITNSYNSTTTGFVAGPVATAISTKQTIKFEGIGVKLGSDFKFNVWRGVKITGDVFYNILYGLTKSTLVSNFNAAAPTYTSSLSTYGHHHGRGFVDAMIGLAYQTTFKKDKYFLDVHAGWRTQYFPDGWAQFEVEYNDSEHSLPLYGQGLEAGLTVKF
jgi:hypothetical protein